MNWLEVLNRIQEGEGLHTEFKSSFADRSAVGKTICAFANTEGGVIILGVDDSQTIVGVRENSEKLQERLTTFLQTACNTPVSARVDRNVAPGNLWVHWIEVPPQRGYEPMRCDGRVWVRRSRSSVEPSPSELQDLYNSFGYILTEERTIDAASPSHIDLERFRLYLGQLGLDIDEEPQPTGVDDLRNRGVIREFGGTLLPTLYGIAAFGKSTQAYPQTRNIQVECCAYEGTDRASRVLQVANVTGRLDEQVQRAIGWFSSLGRFEAYGKVIREDRMILPTVALREALVNAVVHRDYSITGSKTLLEVFAGHVDITSPGDLPNHMSVESVRAGGFPRSRNESMAHYMLTMGFMEQRGRGWPVMRRVMREFNGTEPEILNDTHSRFVRVTFKIEPKNSLPCD